MSHCLIDSKRSMLVYLCTAFRFGLQYATTESRHFRSAWKKMVGNEQEQSSDIDDIRELMVEAVCLFILPILLYLRERGINEKHST